MLSPNTDIILIGPVRTGKSTLGRLLAEKLSLPQVSLDSVRQKYYREIGYDEDLARSIRRQGGFLTLYLYWNMYDAYAIERLLEEYHQCVFDFGAGNGISESREGFRRIQNALAPYANIFLILPSPDKEASLRILKERDAEPPSDLTFDLNRHFLKNGAYFALAKHVMYTEGRSPEETRDEIIDLLV